MHLLSASIGHGIRHRVAEKPGSSSTVNDGSDKRGEGSSRQQVRPPIPNIHYEPELGDQNDLHVDRAAYRTLPIVSGILIPFSIMLSIPSLTGHWYVRTDEDSSLLEVKQNPLLLDIGMAFSMACGVLANTCLVIRFSERRIKLMTILCITFLSLHDIINIPAVTLFGVVHRFDDGFTYGQSFWLTVCSTIFSTTTNVTLIYDYLRTKDFTHSGSGLTVKQRSLLIILIILLCYVSLASALLAVTLNITFLDGLYLAVVSIETIGFGDLHPTSTGTRILACIFITGGILNLALLVALSREALLEAAAEGVQARMRLSRSHARERNIRTRWRAAVHWRLNAEGLPTWVDDRDEERQGRVGQLRHWYSWPRRLWRRMKGEAWREWEDPSWKYVYGPGHKRLNLRALSDTQLETAALEAGLPLSELIPKDFNLHEDEYLPSDSSEGSLATSWRHPYLATGGVEAGMLPPSLTHVRVGGMVSLLANFAFAVTHGPGYDMNESPSSTDDDEGDATERTGHSHGVPFNKTHTSMTLGDDEDGIYVPESLETVERNAFYARLSVALSLFFIFWMVGSAIFMKTEGWEFGSAIYFCFVSFSTVGYGDLAPRTQAGRSIFIVWALLGVGTMTILISILAEAFSSSYKSVIKSDTIMPPPTDTPPDPKHLPNRHTSLLSAHTMSLPSARDHDTLHSNGSTLVGDRLTPLYPTSILATSAVAGGLKARRATLMVTIPEPPHAVANARATHLAALPMDVLRRVDYLMSIIATRALPSGSVGAAQGDVLQVEGCVMGKQLDAVRVFEAVSHA
ncbi:hypothetical protein HYPSUDRAFT_132499 [Hypholoma sublateritium FD-334 SS-4]|uniref:Potassium channel domain-containing protein n=1 Tax=Hypholoma sublateritium (strain FD-334 SS-4) TaxID=945553 RepID=A0A0D2Q5G1_HYPSF|nr:hypothetical protein HYPSUDRAFT_132499 [Hypholoma sublateritium FD-334 SS-4]